MKLLTKNESEFKALLETLINELVDANCHFTLHQKLSRSFASEEYAIVYTQSPAFWNLTLSAHCDAVLVRLCKAYDQYDRSKPTLTLRSFLETVGQNLHFFEPANFRERLKDNQFVDSLTAQVRAPDASQLQEDIESVGTGNHRVQKLINWRDKIYSHLSANAVLDPKTFNEQNWLSFDDIDALLRNGLDIMNRYLASFAASHYMTEMAGQNDYLRVLNAVRKGVDDHKKEIEKLKSRAAPKN